MSSTKTVIVIQRIWDDGLEYEIFGLVEQKTDIIPTMVADRIASLGDDIDEWGKPEFTGEQERTVIREMFDLDNGHDLWGFNWIAREMEVQTFS